MTEESGDATLSYDYIVRNVGINIGSIFVNCTMSVTSRASI